VDTQYFKPASSYRVTRWEEGWCQKFFKNLNLSCYSTMTESIVKRNDWIGQIFLELLVQEESRLSVGSRQYEFSYLLRAQLFWSHWFVYRQYKWWARQAYIGRYCARREDWIPSDGTKVLEVRKIELSCVHTWCRDRHSVYVYFKDQNSSLRGFTAVNSVFSLHPQACLHLS
jgi:hypothetical protein